MDYFSFKTAAFFIPYGLIWDEWFEEEPYYDVWG